MSVKGYLSGDGAVLIGADQIMSQSGRVISAASQQLNLLASPNDAQNWVASGSGVTVATTSTSTDLPLLGICPTAIKITPVSGTDYARARWTMPEALKNTRIGVSWFQRPLSGYASGDFKVEVYKNSSSNYGGSYTEFALTTDVSGTSSIPNSTTQYVTTFDADTADYYEIRIVRVSGTTALNITDVVVSPNPIAQTSVITAWQSFTPTISWGGSNVLTGRYRRVGQNVEFKYGITLNGAPSGSQLNVDLPAGLTQDTSSILALGRAESVAKVVVYRNGQYWATGTGEYDSSITGYSLKARFQIEDPAGTANVIGPAITTTSPSSWTTGDFIYIEGSVPVSGWTATDAAAVGYSEVTQNFRGLVRSAGQLLGTNTNDNASSGYVGEHVSDIVNQGSSLSLSTDTAKTVGAISLTAGDWDVYYGANFLQSGGGTLTTTSTIIGLSTTANTLPSTTLYGDTRWGSPTGPNTNENSTISAPPKRVSISSTTTYYLVVQASFSGSTMNVSGTIAARRVR